MESRAKTFALSLVGVVGHLGWVLVVSGRLQGLFKASRRRRLLGVACHHMAACWLLSRLVAHLLHRWRLGVRHCVGCARSGDDASLLASHTTAEKVQGAQVTPA